MKYRFYNRIILIVLLILCSFSCSSDLDYDQANDFHIQPVFTTNLAYLNEKAPDLVENGIEQRFFAYLTSAQFLNNSFVQEDLVKAEMFFRVKNTINRSFIFRITFYDQNDQPIYNISVDVPASSGTETLIEKKETFTAANINILKSTVKLGFSVAMQNDGPPLTESSQGRIEFSSSITAYFDVE